MSTTFTCQNVEYNEVRTPCDFPGCSAENRCGYCEDGFEVTFQPDSIEINWNGSNAFAILKLLALPVSDCGEIALDTIPLVRQTIFAAINLPRQRKEAVREARVEHGADHATVYHGEFSDQDVQERLLRLDALLAQAEERGCAVVWG